MGNPIYRVNVLTVVFRNDAPLVCCEDSPTYRSVQVELTNDQIAQLGQRYTHTVVGTAFHESISKCFLERKGGA